MTSFGSFLRQLARDIWSQKLRTFLTVFGIIWGTVAVALLLAVGEGVHRRQTRSFAGLGDRIVIAWPSRTSLPFEGLGKGRRIRVDESDIEFLEKRVEGLAGISSEYTENLRVTFGDRKRLVDVSGVVPIFGEMRNLIPAEGGRFINPTDLEQRRRVVFVGNELAEDLFGELDPVGREVMLHGSPFTVVGVLLEKDQDSSYSGRDHSNMYIPSTTFRALTGRRYVNLFIYKAPTPDQNKQLTERVLAALGERKRFDPRDTQALGIWDTTDMFVWFDTFMLAFKLFMGFMGVLTLTVGGIGVSNIMNVVVEERTREIGIKMALGAKGRTVLGQFLLETLVLTAIGGVIGLAVTWGFCSVVEGSPAEDAIGTPVLSPQIALLTAGVLGLVGFLAGYFPARGASRLDPVVAMKL
ncbi:MAG: ABC transporter permease [Thermoanaerobaculales bacterium]|nr:ABC transporter permease [Thermoanaerobaculales bacterium]